VTTTSRAYRLFLLHPIRFIRRLLAEHASPRSLGAAAALGVLVGASPLIGVHTFLVYYLACRLRLNRVMALGTNQLCMPPFVPALCIEVGYYLRHGEFLTEVSLRTLGREALERVLEWAIGACIVGPMLAVAVGGSVWVVAAYLQRSGAVGSCGSSPLDPPCAKGEGAGAGRGAGDACESNPLDPPFAKGERAGAGRGAGGERVRFGKSEKATPAGQPRAAGTASPAPAPIDGRHP
jgi:uncharacterized protein (DUF2062 family)